MSSNRWTIVRPSSPAVRGSEPQTRRTVIARCTCGVEQRVWLDDIQSDRSTGCKSHRCRARADVADELVSDLGDTKAARSMRERLDTWMLECGRRDRLGYDDADDIETPPTRACVRRDLAARAGGR